MDMSIAALATIRPTLRLNRKEVDRRLGYPRPVSNNVSTVIVSSAYRAKELHIGSLSLAYRLHIDQQIDQYIRLHTKIISIKFGR